jgi:hypothetical protein
MMDSCSVEWSPKDCSVHGKPIATPIPSEPIQSLLCWSEPPPRNGVVGVRKSTTVFPSRRFNKITSLQRWNTAYFVKVHKRFGERFCVHLQGRRVRQACKWARSRTVFIASFLLIACLSYCKYCNVFGRLETRFAFFIGFINNLQVVTTINYNTVAGLHNLQSLHTNLFSLSPLIFTDVYHRN